MKTYYKVLRKGNLSALSNYPVHYPKNGFTESETPLFLFEELHQARRFKADHTSLLNPNNLSIWEVEAQGVREPPELVLSVIDTYSDNVISFWEGDDVLADNEGVWGSVIADAVRLLRQVE